MMRKVTTARALPFPLPLAPHLSLPMLSSPQLLEQQEPPPYDLAFPHSPLQATAVSAKAAEIAATAAEERRQKHDAADDAQRAAELRREEIKRQAGEALRARAFGPTPFFRLEGRLACQASWATIGQGG